MKDGFDFSFGARLRDIRRKKGISQAQAAEFLTEYGLPATQKAVSKWERDDTQPGARQLLMLCRLYDIRDVLEMFFGLPANSIGLNDAGKRRVDEYIRLLKNDPEFSYCRKEPVRHARMIPLYDIPVSAGTGQFLDGESSELIEAHDTVPESAEFAVRISGDSMTPRFVDRQIIYVKPQQTLEHGETGIFVLNGDAYCKVFSVTDGAELISINKKYPPIKISEYDELRIIGKVVG